MRIAKSATDSLTEEATTGSPAQYIGARVFGAVVGVSLLALAAGQAQAASRTLSLYHVHTKERITVTYWKDGRFLRSGLRKLNWFLRDWRRNVAVRIDPRTIDLIWKLHKDLGSKKPIQIISGHRSARTNAMLRRIGRRVARRSRHITGQAIDFRFPDVPMWKVRNLALAYGIGGVGYYRANNFVHVDTGNVRHWPRISPRRYAAIVRKYRRLIGRGWKRHGGDIMVASRGTSKRTNFNRNASLLATRAKIAELKKKIARAEARKARKGKAVARNAAKTAPKAPVPLPGVKPVEAIKPAAKPEARPAATVVAAAPRPRPRPYEVLVLAASRMEVTPAAAPATLTNFARPGSARDPIGIVIASLPQDEQIEHKRARAYPRVRRDGKGDLAVALVSGAATHVPTLDRRMPGARTAAGKGDPLVNIGMTAQAMIRRDGAPYLQAPGKPAVSAATAAVWPVRLRGTNGAKPRKQRVNRAEKGDLLTSAALPPAKVRKAAFRYGALQAADLRPFTFR